MEGSGTTLERGGKDLHSAARRRFWGVTPDASCHVLTRSVICDTLCHVPTTRGVVLVPVVARRVVRGYIYSAPARRAQRRGSEIPAWGIGARGGAWRGGAARVLGAGVCRLARGLLT